MSGLCRWLPLVLAAGLLSSCETAPSGNNRVGPHATMQGWINEASNSIWDVRNSARSERDRVDPARMHDADWLKLQEATSSLEYHFQRLAQARPIRVERHGDERSGLPSQSEIQARIDADPSWFRGVALRMAENAHDLNSAAKARNPQLAGDLIEKLNEPCQTCHTRYWTKTAQ